MKMIIPASKAQSWGQLVNRHFYSVCYILVHASQKTELSNSICWSKVIELSVAVIRSLVYAQRIIATVLLLFVLLQQEAACEGKHMYSS